MDLKNLNLKSFISIKKFKKRESGVKPDLYWMWILSLTFVLILFAMFFSFHFFMDIKNRSESVSEDLFRQKNIREDRLNKALSYFEARLKKSESILSQSSSLVDPSL